MKLDEWVVFNVIFSGLNLYAAAHMLYIGSVEIACGSFFVAGVCAYTAWCAARG